MLLDAWFDFYKICPKAKLRVCGGKQPNVKFDQVALEKCNVEFNLYFISDDDYYNYVKSTRYVILPYISGTNSGIISTVLSLGTDVITSDIPMFSENPLVKKEDCFKSEDKESLIAKLEQKHIQKINTSSSKLTSYRKSFDNGVVHLYKKILAND